MTIFNSMRTLCRSASHLIVIIVFLRFIWIRINTFLFRQQHKIGDQILCFLIILKQITNTTNNQQKKEAIKWEIFLFSSTLTTNIVFCNRQCIFFVCDWWAVFFVLRFLLVKHEVLIIQAFLYDLLPIYFKRG